MQADFSARDKFEMFDSIGDVNFLARDAGLFQRPVEHLAGRPDERLAGEVLVVARLFADAGAVAVVSLVSPLREARDHARQLHAEAELPFFEVFVDTPVEECARRDPKGLYAKAREGRLSTLTGKGSPYEPPTDPELTIKTLEEDVDAKVYLRAARAAGWQVETWDRYVGGSSFVRHLPSYGF